MDTSLEDRDDEDEEEEEEEEKEAVGVEGRGGGDGGGREGGEGEEEEILNYEGMNGSYEEIKLGEEYVDLPSGLMEEGNSSMLEEILSLETWNTLSSDTQNHLSTFLPDFPSDDLDQKDKTLDMLFKRENFHFGNPLKSFSQDLVAGRFQADGIRLNKILKKARFRFYKQRQRERRYLLLQEILMSRKKLFESCTGVSPPTPLSVLKMEKKSIKTGPDIEYRTAKRYHNELRLIRSAVGEEGDSSEDEGCPPNKSPRQKEINLLESDYWKTLSKTETDKDILDLPDLNFEGDRSSQVGDSKPDPPLPSLFEDLNNHSDTQFVKKVERSSGDESSQEKPLINDVSVVEEAVSNIPGMTEEDDSIAQGILHADALLSPEALLPLTPLKQSELPPPTSTPPPPPPVVVMSPPRVPQVQSYFCLLRDIFLCHPEFKITIPALEESVRTWQTNTENVPLWVSLVECWVTQIPSAVAFLTGAFPDAQPKDFSPFIDCDPSTGNYEWIGSGRDTDVDLMALNQWWFERRDVCRAITTSGGNPNPSEAILNSIPEPIPQHNLSYTDWTVRPSTDHEKLMYRLQEKQRYSQPSQAFTYHIHGYTTTVGPIKGVGSFPSKAKNHALLVFDRPSCVTILSLVKDAVARLPNGEGTRPDIVELLKDSQYLNSNADPQALTSAVSGALDRLQSEIDSCVKYESIKKTWIYLHRQRSEADFIRIFNEQLAMPKSALKPKRVKSRKSLSSVNPTAISMPPATILETALSGVQIPMESKDISTEDAMMNAVQSILPQVPVPPSPPSRQVENVTTSISPPLLTHTSQQRQTVQLMTPEGLKTYQLNIPIQTTSSQRINASSGNRPSSTTLLKQSQSLLLDQPTNRHNHTTKQVVYNYQKTPVQMPTKKPDPPKLISNNQQSILLNNKAESTEESGGLRINVPSTSSVPSPQPVQRVIVKNSEGKPVQLSAESLQKLLSSGALKSGLQIALPSSGHKSSATKIQPGNQVIIQRPNNRHTSHINQVLSSPPIKNQTIQGIRYVQLGTSSVSSPSGAPPSVRILSSNQSASPIRLAGSAKLLSIPQQVKVVSSNNVLSQGIKVPMSSNHISVHRNASPQVLGTSTAKSQVVQLSHGNIIGGQQAQQQQVVIQTSSGKPIVLNHQALQNARITNIQNVRILQSRHQSSINSDGKVVTRILQSGSTSNNA